MISTPVIAAETITYSYDIKGRLTKVVRIGTVNNNATVDYTHDTADNRTRLKTTNLPNPWRIMGQLVMIHACAVDNSGMVLGRRT